MNRPVPPGERGARMKRPFGGTFATVSSDRLGETVMTELQNLDEGAYIRFASVHPESKDVLVFTTALKDRFEHGD